MKTSLKRIASACALTAACLGASSAAQAQLTYQGVTFTPSYSGNTLTLEIDAANPTGDWATATTIGGLQIKDIGTFDSVTVGGLGAGWTISDEELNANGCTGGSDGIDRVCIFGTHIALTDDMIFTFTFTGGTQDFTEPFVKVLFYEGDNPDKVGSLLSMGVPAIPEPATYALLLGGLGVIGVARRRALKQS